MNASPHNEARSIRPNRQETSAVGGERQREVNDANNLLVWVVNNNFNNVYISKTSSLDQPLAQANTADYQITQSPPPSPNESYQTEVGYSQQPEDTNA